MLIFRLLGLKEGSDSYWRWIKRQPNRLNDTSRIERHLPHGDSSQKVVGCCYSVTRLKPALPRLSLMSSFRTGLIFIARYLDGRTELDRVTAGTPTVFEY